MNKELMEYFYQEARFLKWEDYLNCMIQPTDSYEVCRDKIGRVTICFDSHLSKAWNYFKAIYEDIPLEHRMPLLMEAIYQSYRVDYVEMLEMITDYYSIDETAELKEKRMNYVKEVLKDYIGENGRIKLYRGMAEWSLMPDYAVSYTTSKEVADFFVEHHKLRRKSRFGVVDTIEFDVEDILFCSDDRQEQEVFVIPYCVRAGCFVEENDDLELLDEINFCSYYSEADDMAILEEIWEQQDAEKEERVGA